MSEEMLEEGVSEEVISEETLESFDSEEGVLAELSLDVIGEEEGWLDEEELKAITSQELKEIVIPVQSTAAIVFNKLFFIIIEPRF